MKEGQEEKEEKEEREGVEGKERVGEGGKRWREEDEGEVRWMR